MEPRISIITLGVRDLKRSWKFYHEGLGFPTTRTPDQGIIFYGTHGVCLALYPYDKLAEDVGISAEGAPPRFTGITLAHVVKTKEEVEEVISNAVQAGAHLEKPPQDVFWGGYSGYFSDPDGYLWEVACGGFEFHEDGSINLS